MRWSFTQGGVSIASKDRKKWWVANLEANGCIEPEFVEALQPESDLSAFSLSIDSLLRVQ